MTNEEYKKISRIIKSNKDLSETERMYLLNYATDVKDGKCNNDFYEYDFLYRVILEVMNNGNIIRTFENMKKVTKILLPAGLETPEYELIKNMIVNGNTEIDTKLFPLIENKFDYTNIIKIINEEAKDCFDMVVDYALDVAPYCINQNILVSEIISFINCLKYQVGDKKEYYNYRVQEAKKRCGIYPIDEKSLALISDEAKKAQSLIKKLDNIKERVTNYQETVKKTTTTGKKEIEDFSITKVKELQDNIDAAKEEIINKLDEYLLTLEQELKKNSDEIFNRILNDTKNKLREIRLAAENLSAQTTNELLRVQRASEDSVQTLKKYVESEPRLQEYLKSAADSETIREALIKMNETQSHIVHNNGILIPGNDRIVVPANANVILPHEEIEPFILSAFDESIPFEERYKKILDEKKRREENGEIFHYMVDEVINCVMEGDWVYLWGPSGCGKSHIIKQVASLIGIDLVDNGKITDKYSIMAYNDPHGRFRATQAFVALTYGKLLSLDEFDNGNTDTQVVLNELYSGLLDSLEQPNKKRYVTFAEDMSVPINPNFRMISAGNTPGGGENQIFSSRGKIDESVQERMTPKRFDYDNKVEKIIFGEYENWYNLFINFRKCCEEYAKKFGLSTAPGITTTRDASAIRKYINHNSKSVDQVLMEKFIQTKDENYLKVIFNTMKKMYDIDDIEDIEINSNVKLGQVDELVLAKKLIYKCKR